MKMAARIREWMATQDGPRTSSEIAEGVGYATPGEKQRIQWAVADQVRKGRVEQYPAATVYTLAKIQSSDLAEGA